MFRLLLGEKKNIITIIIHYYSIAITIFAKLAQYCNIRLSEPLSSTKINKIAC